MKWMHLRLYMSDKLRTCKCVYMTRILVKNSRPIDAFSPRFPCGIVPKQGLYQREICSPDDDTDGLS